MRYCPLCNRKFPLFWGEIGWHSPDVHNLKLSCPGIVVVINEQ